MLLESWVWWTLLAATMQAVRTAGQKHLSADVSPLAATLVRYLYGLPFAYLWFLLLSLHFDFKLPLLNARFLWSGLAAGLFQIIATVLLVRLFSLRNFAIGTTYVKSEIMLTASIGFIFFTEVITTIGWLAIIICVLGLIIISIAKSGGLRGLWSRPAAYGLASGLCFSLTSLFLRQASLSLELGSNVQPSGVLSAGLTLVYMVTLQTIVTLVLVRWRQPGEITAVIKAWRPALFIGFTGVLGSIGWFTAMTLESASYVKTLGQLEFVMTLLIAIFFFHEKPSRTEIIGMLLIVLGGVLLLLPLP